ncbi:hypothetical protein MY04_05715 (plasmid) [Flammeovirga sp. MY04]|uniref:hypothetical protein n=1 Tax=Flammeovirga sp. MY04 TaxID=1191459 RepID=UPI000806100B|nr:hypothetical protein [Flammeovirga sp. MY04]ANQ52873.1 hypothetical protein MY04_05715 [Flammeovirga sp. MY04]
MRGLIIINLIGCVFFSCDNKDENINPNFASILSSPSKIKYILNNKSYYPESFDFDEKNNRFIIGSFNNGGIKTFDPISGKYTDLVTENYGFVSITGIHVDEKNDRIIVVCSDLGIGEKSSINTVGVLAKLGVFDLKTGGLMKILDLGKYVSLNNGIFLNDITIDKESNIYVTNSFGNSEIFKVDNNYKVSVLDIMKDLNANLSGELGFTGINYHKSTNSLIVGHNNLGKLYAIPLFSLEPYLLTNGIESVDGIELLEDNELYITQNAVGKIKAFKLSVENKIIQAKGKDLKSVVFNNCPTVITTYKKE